MYLTYFNENKQRVPKVPYNTAWITVRVWVYPWRVTVCAGSGTVWENPTCGIPMFNPKGRPLPDDYERIWALVDQLRRVTHPFDLAHISSTTASSIIIWWSCTNSQKSFLTSSTVKYGFWTLLVTLNGEYMDTDGLNFMMPKVPAAMMLWIT